ncbi:Uncharacterized protein Mb2734 [Linum perenne]
MGLNTAVIYQTLLRHLLSLAAGIRPERVNLDPGTVINIWAPSRTSKTRPTIVFIHGFGFNALLTWQLQLIHFSKRYAVYAPDLLFFGDSFTDDPRRSPEFQAECIGRALMKLGVERCTVVGFSYGGSVGFKMAEMFDGLVESLVLSGSVMGFTERIGRDGLDRIGYGSWVEYMMPDCLDGFKEFLRIATYKLPWLPARLLKDALEVLFEHKKERVELLEALFIHDDDFKVGNYSKLFMQKTHFIWGQNDRLIHIQECHNQIKLLNGNATLYTIEKAGHLAQLERPFVYNKHLMEYLGSLYPRDG